MRWSWPIISLAVLPTLITPAAPAQPGAADRVYESVTTVEVLLPTGATAKLDGHEISNRSARGYADIPVAPIPAIRAQLDVTFVDGTADQRLVDLLPGQHVRVPVPYKPADKPALVMSQVPPAVLGVAVTRDKRFIAVALDSGHAVLWDTTLGKPVRTLTGHTSAVQSISFNHDDTRLLTGSADGTAAVWDVATGQRLHTLKGHKGAVMSAAFGPDGKRVLTGSTDQTAILWDLARSQPIHTLASHTGEVHGVAYGPRGDVLATASLDRHAILWDAETGKPRFTLQGHGDAVSSAAFTPDGTRLGTGSYDNTGMIWDVANGKRLSRTGRHQIDIYGVAFTPDARRVITVARDEVGYQWDVTTSQRIRTFAGHTSDVTSLAITADGRLLVTGSRDGTVRVWDLATGIELAALTTSADRRTWAVVAPDGLFDATASGRQLVGFRFSRLPGAAVDHFFRDHYRPGLLAELVAGQRPFVEKPFAHAPPPLVKIISPKVRAVASSDFTLEVEVTDRGGGVSGLSLYHNGALASAAPTAMTSDAGVTKATFAVPLVQGPNRLSVRAGNADGSWASVPAELEVACTRAPERKGRLYVVAIDAGRAESQELDALVSLLRRRGAKTYDRIDVVPLRGADASRVLIGETVRDVAGLAKPHDTVVVVVCGAGRYAGDQVRVIGGGRPEAEHVAVSSIAELLSRSPALRRVLIADLRAADALPQTSLRHQVERLARDSGIHVAMSVAPAEGDLLRALARGGETVRARHSAKDRASSPQVDVNDWFDATDAPCAALSTHESGFPIFSAER